MRHIFFRALLVTGALFLSSCDGQESELGSGAFGGDRVTGREEGAGLFRRSRETEVTRNTLSRGTDSFLLQNGKNAGANARSDFNIVDGKLVELDLVNSSIPAAAEAVIGKILNKSYVIGDGVSGTVTLQTTGPIPKSSLVDLFQTALASNGAILKQEGGKFTISKSSNGLRAFQSSSQPIGSGAAIVAAPLRYISATQMVNLLKPLIEEGLSVVPDQKRNLLLLSGSKSQLEAAMDALNLFDVDVLDGKSVALIQLKAADPSDVVAELTTIFEAETGGMLEGVIEFLPNDRLKSVLVITTRSTYLARAQKWVREMDRVAGGSRRYTEVYALQNRDASEVGEVLQGLLATAAENGEGNGSGADGTSRVAVDSARNAVIVKALEKEHGEIVAVLSELDTSPKQVLLEATIAEVSLKNDVSLGVRWYLETGLADVGFTDISSDAIAADRPGFSAVFSPFQIKAALNALAGETDVKIISSPTLMVLNNKDAVLQIGDEVPIATKTSSNQTDSTDTVITTVDYRNTGVILKVKPRIGSNGRVMLDIEQEVSDVSKTNTSGIDSPTIRQRQITTSVALQDGMTLALGGLVQQGDSLTRTKVPGVGDIPVLGAAFRNHAGSKSRSELLILIRPRVIKSDTDAGIATREWREKLAAANGILQTGLGKPTHTVQNLLE